MVADSDAERGWADFASLEAHFKSIDISSPVWSRDCQGCCSPRSWFWCEVLEEFTIWTARKRHQTRN